MVKKIKPADLGNEIEQQLTTYHADIIGRINQCGSDTIKAIAKKTKATAPKDTGAFRKSITSGVREGNRGNKYVWYVKAPHYRRTHLLVNGYPKQNGGRVEGDPFLQNALDEELPVYEAAMEEAVKA